MLDQDTIIDAPLNRGAVYEQPYLMANRWDFFTNLFFISIAAILTILNFIPGYGDDVLILIAMLFFFMGVYQVLSCLVGIFRGNKAKQNYGLFVIVYGVLSFLILSAISDFDGDIEIFVFILFIPGLMAVYYTWLCYLAYQRAKGPQAMSSSAPETT